MKIHTTVARRPSWRGIIAGLLMGLVVSMAMLALALVLSSFLSLDLRGAGIMAGIYAVVTALLSSFVAGFFAVKASAPEALFGDGTDILPKDATLTGILTAATIVVITSFFAMNGVSSVIRTAGNVVGTTANAIGGAASAVTSTTITATAADVATANADGNLVGRAEELYQKAMGNIGRQDIEAWLAKNNETLDRTQVGAAVNVLEGLLNQTRVDIAQMDFTNLETWKNIDDYAKKRADEIENALTGDELINRLQAQGLNRAQAVEVQQETLASYHEYRANTEQAIADARLKVEQALQAAEDTARKAALYSGILWLISTLMTFLASVAGARAAAASYRLAAAPVVLRDHQNH
ncbi:TIGR04086 family membrane protein [Moraxella sp. Tifton1]|uniref:TIGR04086 family membrane protein n=1 Tax=Moraxella oculi TaxID=2940516 RepID=UPI002010DF7A|nr:TIGR04086 family membrane protein [Moraxella sp. Tifton1]MCL1624080.1 TIGR04086 family membrane protein [Moraxella sp. Tifton1]